MRLTITALALLAALPAAARTYVIEGNHTFPTVEYSHLGLSGEAMLAVGRDRLIHVLLQSVRENVGA